MSFDGDEAELLAGLDFDYKPEHARLDASLEDGVNLRREFIASRLGNALKWDRTPPAEVSDERQAGRQALLGFFERLVIERQRRNRK